jgi:chromosome segregation ATPase
VSCQQNVTRDLLARLDREQRDLDALKDKRRDIDDKRSRAADDAEKAKWTAELEAVDRDIDASKRRLDDLHADVDRRRDLVERTISTISKCADYRQAVMNVFAYATDKVRGESDPELVPYARQLRHMYSEEIRGHQLQIDARNNALATCKAERP